VVLIELSHPVEDEAAYMGDGFDAHHRSKLKPFTLMHEDPAWAGATHQEWDRSSARGFQI